MLTLICKKTEKMCLSLCVYCYINDEPLPIISTVHFNELLSSHYMFLNLIILGGIIEPLLERHQLLILNSLICLKLKSWGFLILLSTKK